MVTKNKKKKKYIKKIESLSYQNRIIYILMICFIILLSSSVLIVIIIQRPIFLMKESTIAIIKNNNLIWMCILNIIFSLLLFFKWFILFEKKYDIRNDPQKKFKWQHNKSKIICNSFLVLICISLSIGSLNYRTELSNEAITKYGLTNHVMETHNINQIRQVTYGISIGNKIPSSCYITVDLQLLSGDHIFLRQYEFKNIYAIEKLDNILSDYHIQKKVTSIDKVEMLRKKKTYSENEWEIIENLFKTK